MNKTILNKIELYADGADEKEILNFNKMKIIKGLTTNPSLMKKSGVEIRLYQQQLKTHVLY